MNSKTPLVTLASFILCTGLAAQNWPSFRGQQAQGVADQHPLPSKWDVTKGTNLRWQTRIPGMGHASPVVWGNRIFLTTALKAGEKASLKVGRYGSVESVEEKGKYSWHLYCLDKKTGKVLWQKQSCAGKPQVKRHPKSSQANPTPCTNGKYVIAFFGSEGMYCYDMTGNLVWKKNFGVLDAGWYMHKKPQWGGGSSPVIHEDLVILQCDVQKNSFLAAFNLKDGKERWRSPRADVPTWGTPTIFTGKTTTQVIINGYKHIGGYDLATGKKIWWLRGGGDIPVPTPVLGSGLVYITNAHGRKSPVYAIRLTAKGDITLDKDTLHNKHIAWSISRGGNYMTTPLLYKDHLYCCADSGRLTCFAATTGKVAYSQYLRKRGAFTASPVAAAGRIYLPGERGDIHVIIAGPQLKILAVNEMKETCMATPAISEGLLLIRTRHHLFAIGNPK